MKIAVSISVLDSADVFVVVDDDVALIIPDTRLKNLIYNRPFNSLYLGSFPSGWTIFLSQCR